MNEPLHQLLARCEAGDDDAIAQLVRRFRSWAIDFAAAIMEDETLAEDAVQEAFITALQRLPELREPAAFPAWLRQIVRTQAHRITRKRRELPIAKVADLSDKEPTPPETLDRQELHRKVREAVELLPPAGRQTVELFYLHERSCAEVADLLHIPQGTVKRRLHDARKRLRGMLLGHIDGSTTRAEQEKPGGQRPPL